MYVFLSVDGVHGDFLSSSVFLTTCTPCHLTVNGLLTLVRSVAGVLAFVALAITVAFILSGPVGGFDPVMSPPLDWPTTTATR